MANQCFSKLTHNMFAHWPLFNWTPVSRGKELNRNVREDGFVVLRWCGLRHRDKGRETGFAFVLMNFLWFWARKGIFFSVSRQHLLHLSRTLCQISSSFWIRVDICLHVFIQCHLWFTVFLEGNRSSNAIQSAGWKTDFFFCVCFFVVMKAV